MQHSSTIGAFVCYHYMTWLNITKNPLAPYPKAPAEPINIHIVCRYHFAHSLLESNADIHSISFPHTYRLEDKNYSLLRLPGHLSRQNLITDSVLGCSLIFLEQEWSSSGTRSADNPHVYLEGSFPSLLNHEQLRCREFSPWCLFHSVLYQGTELWFTMCFDLAGGERYSGFNIFYPINP